MSPSLGYLRLERRNWSQRGQFNTGPIAGQKQANTADQDRIRFLSEKSDAEERGAQNRRLCVKSASSKVRRSYLDRR